MDTEISTVISRMRVKRQALLERADKVSAAIVSLEEIFGERVDDGEEGVAIQASAEVNDGGTEGDPRPSPPRQNSNIPGPFVGMTVHNAAIRVLQARGTPLKTRFIADELTNGGLVSSGMYRAVYNSLSLSSEAILEDKQWHLKAWKQGN